MMKCCTNSPVFGHTYVFFAYKNTVNLKIESGESGSKDLIATKIDFKNLEPTLINFVNLPAGVFILS